MRYRRPRVGDVVVRIKDVGTGQVLGNLRGVVTRVTPRRHGSGGSRAALRVLWDNGYEGSVDDRQVRVVDRPRPVRDPMTTHEAAEIEVAARSIDDPDALEVAADAWEEAGEIARAERLRANANELVVVRAVNRLRYDLERSAREVAQQVEFGSVEPRGDFFLNDTDPAARSRRVKIPIPDRITPSRTHFYEAYLRRQGDRTWAAGYAISRAYEGTIEESGLRTFTTQADAIDHLVNAYQRRFDKPLTGLRT